MHFLLYVCLTKTAAHVTKPTPCHACVRGACACIVKSVVSVCEHRMGRERVSECQSPLFLLLASGREGEAGYLHSQIHRLKDWQKGITFCGGLDSDWNTSYSDMHDVSQSIDSSEVWMREFLLRLRETANFRHLHWIAKFPVILSRHPGTAIHSFLHYFGDFCQSLSKLR